MAQFQQIPFQEMASSVDSDSDYEKSVWQLASILFDEQDPETYGVPAAHKDIYDHRIRKDHLVDFWEQLCGSSAKKAAHEATTAEDRAIAYLSAHKVVDACEALVQGKDFRLATLIAQIGGDEVMREDISTQIQAWRDLTVLSEMTEPIRTLYSLVAGEVCKCEAKKGPLEDRVSEIIISERFNLDWRRAFGMRLFYAILVEEPIEAAVVKFANDIQSDEPKKPILPLEEDDPAGFEREDILWGLLKLYAASKSALPTPSISEIFAPRITTGNPLDTRLSFQLYHAFTPRFPQAPASDPVQADAFAWTFASQLNSAGEWMWALFAILHLSQAEQRDRAIRAHLAHHASNISTEAQLQTLIDTFKIPASWIWDAKALYARTVLQDHVQEVDYLVRAGDWEEAHEVLRKEVGPTAVIEEDWDMLHGVLEAFQPGKNDISDYDLGGQVYQDYLSILKLELSAGEKQETLGRLLMALPSISKGELKQKVAVQEMSAVVGREFLKMEELVSGLLNRIYTNEWLICYREWKSHRSYSFHSQRMHF